MYLACIPHVSCISDTYLSGYIWNTCIPICILEVSRMYPLCIIEPLQIHVSRMYPACIPHVSRMYPSCISRAFLLAGVPTLQQLQGRAKEMKRARTAAVHLDQLIDLKHLALRYYEPMPAPWRVQDTCIVILYLGVSWCIVMKSPRYMYLDVSWYVSRVTSRKRIGYMYPDVSYVYPACILNSFEIRVKYMQNVKIHVFSRNLTEHVRYIWDTSGYIRIRVSFRIQAGYIRIRIR